MDLESKLLELGAEGSLILKNYGYESAILGVDVLTGGVVYSYEKMVEYLMEKEHFSEEEAQEWIEFNILGALPYGGEKAPIVIQTLPQQERTR